MDDAVEPARGLGRRERELRERLVFDTALCGAHALSECGDHRVGERTAGAREAFRKVVEGDDSGAQITEKARHRGLSGADTAGHREHVHRSAPFDGRGREAA